MFVLWLFHRPIRETPPWPGGGGDVYATHLHRCCRHNRFGSSGHNALDLVLALDPNIYRTIKKMILSMN